MRELHFKPKFKIGDIIEIRDKVVTILGYYKNGYIYSSNNGNASTEFIKKHYLTGMVKVGSGWDNHLHDYINENAKITKCLKDY